MATRNRMNPHESRMYRHLRALCTALAGAMALCAEPGAARAEEGKPALPDVVILKNGGMLRGSIVEMDPQKKVVILLPSGETRTVEMAEVSYAGSESGRPAPAPAAPGPSQRPSPEGGAVRPFVTVEARGAPLSLAADNPDVTFHIRTSSAMFVGVRTSAVGTSYEEICTAPCEATLPTGAHHLAASIPGGTPVPSEDPVRIQGPSRIDATYTSNAGLRTAGVLLSIGGMVGGTMLAFAPLLSREPGDKLDTTPVVGGLVLMVVGGLGGALLWTIPDRVSFQVTPMPTVVGRPSLPMPSGSTIVEIAASGGLGVKASF